jgi:hypothetical protein
MQDAFRRARRLALASVSASAALAAMHLLAGLASGSSAVLAMGVEFAGDVLGAVGGYGTSVAHAAVDPNKNVSIFINMDVNVDIGVEDCSQGAAWR